MFSNLNKFSTKNKKIYQNIQLNLRDEEYDFDKDLEEDNFHKIERINGLPTKRK
ncbi:MAG: hypothetical protein IJB83_02870 [Bacilli bacterium]|nr:hypothetical protein [Bacilli bacterium]